MDAKVGTTRFGCWAGTAGGGGSAVMAPEGFGEGSGATAFESGTPDDVLGEDDKGVKLPPERVDDIDSRLPLMLKAEDLFGMDLGGGIFSLSFVNAACIDPLSCLSSLALMVAFNAPVCVCAEAPASEAEGASFGKSGSFEKSMISSFVSLLFRGAEDRIEPFLIVFWDERYAR